MKAISVAALAAALVCGSALWLVHDARGDERPAEALIEPAIERTVIDARPVQPDPDPNAKHRPPVESIEDGLKWLASSQGQDGGWGQDGGETSYVRNGENLESSGNDLANTAVAALAFLEGGSTPTRGTYQEELRGALDFLLRGVEQAPADGLALKTISGTQIQRKLGPYIDTFLTSRVLSELNGETGDPALDQRVREALEVCVRKIEAHQQEDGSWNSSGGWAPILGTSMASRSLDVAKQKGFKLDEDVLARVDDYTEKVAKASASPAEAGSSGALGLELR